MRIPERWRAKSGWEAPRRRRALFGVALVSVALGVALDSTDALRRLELETVDARFSIRGDENPPRDLVVVPVDEEDFQVLKHNWPFPRSWHGRVIDRLERAGARVIAYDVQFTEPTTDEEDNALIEAIDRARVPVVLATTITDEGGRTNVLGGDDLLEEIGARAGQSQLGNDPGEVIRRFSFERGGLTSFPVAVAEAARGRRLARPDTGREDPWIDYAGGPESATMVPFWRVYRGLFPADAFRDRIVIVGASSPVLQDVHPTSTSGDELMSGPEIQAHATETVLRGFPLRSTSATFDALLVIGLGLLAPLLSVVVRPGVVLAAVGLAALLYAASVQLAFEGGRMIPAVVPLLGLVTSSVGSLGVYYGVGALERRRMRDLFARFVPEQVVDQVLLSVDQDLRLGGVRREVTVMFSDLRGFTRFSEAREPDEVIRVVNRYLDEMTGAIQRHGGTLVSYMGDGIFAVFGAPIEQPDHATRAVTAAREMAFVRLGRFNRWLTEEGLGDGFRMGIGLQTGPVMAGNVGSEQRVEYTVIGDTTNTASRMETLTKQTEHMVLVSQTTVEQLDGDARDGLVEVGSLEVRGRTEAVRAYGVLDRRKLPRE